jgi:hypothetical protein
MDVVTLLQAGIGLLVVVGGVLLIAALVLMTKSGYSGK